MKRKGKFDTEICVRIETADGGDSGPWYQVIVGNPRRPSEISAGDGDTIAVYGLLRVTTYRTNPRLDK